VLSSLGCGALQCQSAPTPTSSSIPKSSSAHRSLALLHHIRMKAAWRRSLKTLSLAPSLPSAAANHLIRKLGRLGAGQRLRYPHHAQGCDRTLARAASLSAGLDEGLATSNPRPSNSDTIFALSTAPGRAAIAVIRLSGSACLQVSFRGQN
jgi:hypothetical protein